MSQPLTIETDALKLEAWPQLGGKVTSIIDKADGFELLFRSPPRIFAISPYDTDYSKGWPGGWDECFPAPAAGQYPTHPYRGIAVPDHGELWSLPTTAVPAKNGFTCVWHGLRFGYRFVRKLTLDGPVIRAAYSLVNLAPFDFHFVWAMQPLLSMDVPVELSSTGGNAWLIDEKGQALDRPSALPAGTEWKVHSPAPIASPCDVNYPTRGRSLRIGYKSENGVNAYWRIRINTGAWAQQRHLSVQPITGRFDQIDRAVQDGTAACVGPMGRLDWTVTIEANPYL